VDRRKEVSSQGEWHLPYNPSDNPLHIYAVAMISRLYGEKYATHVKETWVPLICLKRLCLQLGCYFVPYYEAFTD
jgi:hypothetical protein